MIGLLASTGWGFEHRLPGTSPLELSDQVDRSSKILQGLHHYVDALQTQMIETQSQRWSVGDASSKRERLRAIIGAHGPIQPTELQWRDSASQKSIWYEDAKVRVRKVTWQVLESGEREAWAEGIWVEPKTASDGVTLVVPPTTGTVEALLEAQAGNESALPWKRGDRHYLILKTVNREAEFSTSETLERQVAVSHREWIHRQSFALGRTLTGYEVLSLEAGLSALKKNVPISEVKTLGLGEGARVALFLTALNPTIQACRLHGDFGPRDQSWKEPLDRNLQGYLKEFGDAAVAAMIAPRRVTISNEALGALPEVKDDKPILVASPGAWREFKDEEVQGEIQKARLLAGLKTEWVNFESTRIPSLLARSASPDPEQEARVKTWSQWSQQEIEQRERSRNAYWQKRLSGQSGTTISAAVQSDRDHLWKDVLGQVGTLNETPAASSKFLYETERARVYELWLEIAPDVAVWSWVGVPKSLVRVADKGDLPKLPVVVCQHGLEGLPEHTFTTDPSTRYSRVYQSYALRLAEQGYLTISPHMPYRGEHEFRSLTRKLNGIGATIYSIALLQHQHVLAWLKAQPYVDAQNIGLYGLSYGGKIAMRLPAILTDYKFSICSGDFNDWIMKVSSDSFAGSYLFTKEYEIWEWNLAERFNHAEMAYLMAPRGFMVEYGHRDGVASSEWVGYEFGKVRRWFDRLNLPDQAALRYFDGPHAIEGTATFDFIRAQFAK